ncbi:MAG: TIGR03905 family TSCPD domain-containing protein [Oscillospiraceae bacterium]|nr:TIGR03905 family TSCPD domain-containing protein [Oscillospiraceae bacterium]
MTYEFTPSGVCSQKITFELDGDLVKNVKFTGGCNGNLKGIGALVEGMKKDEVIEKLSGIRCGFKRTSCPDQLARALSETE